jgi:hypothetical protein
VHDLEWFRRDILPRLATVKLSEIIDAAGCSKPYASDIRRGKWTPRVSTWPALAESWSEPSPTKISDLSLIGCHPERTSAAS